jgi:hypothetical protein
MRTQPESKPGNLDHPASGTKQNDDTFSIQRSYKKFSPENKKQSCSFGCYLCKILGSDYLHSRYEMDCIIYEKNKAILDPFNLNQVG